MTVIVLSEAEECEQERVDKKSNVKGVIIKGNQALISQCQLVSSHEA